MGMANATNDWTAELVEAIPNDGNRYEVIDGELFVTPAPGSKHQAAVGELLLLLQAYLRATRIGYAWVSPADIRYGRHTLVQPDVFVVPLVNGRRPASWREISGLLLAVEVLSPSSKRADRDLKRRLYQRQGIPEYWMIDVNACRLERWRSDDKHPDIVVGTLEWRPDQSHPPLVIDLPAYFSDVLDE